MMAWRCSCEDNADRTLANREQTNILRSLRTIGLSALRMGRSFMQTNIANIFQTVF